MAATAEQAEEDHPRMANPPPVISVETKDTEQCEKNFGQEARTPKHANKKDDGPDTQPKITPDRLERPEDRQGYPSSRPFEARGGAFQPHEPRRQAPPLEYYATRGHSQVMHHLSPRGPRYYASNPPRSRMEGAYPPQPYYDQHASFAEYGPPHGRHFDAPPQHFDVPPPPGYRSSFSGQYPPGPPHQSYGSGYPPERYQVSHGGYYSQQGPHEHYPRDGRYNSQHAHPVSRAVSSSFDRSIKGGEKSKLTKPLSPNVHEDVSLESGDSWKMLKQVHSVDDTAIREQLKKETPTSEEKQPASTSSSLTNSPTEGVARSNAAREAERTVAAAAAAVATNNLNPSSLDSLASVASQQAMETDKKKSSYPSSPGGDSASLDLMKCSSGSSGLIHLPADGKRGRDEERGDVNTASAGDAAGEEIRRAPSDVEQNAKKARIDGKSDESKAKSSPLSITCSPSADKAREAASRMNPPASRSDYHPSPQLMEASLYDKGHVYSNGIETAPPLPRAGHPGHKKQSSYPSLPPRPGSSNSSTLTPAMQGIDHGNVTGAASWEIHAQDSFGNASIGGGHGLTSSFSFQDYPMLPPNESGDGGSAGLPPPVPHGPHVHLAQHHHHPSLESRNQSFEGGHYHGSFDYGLGRPGMAYGGSGHQGQFPPHAPSWGTAGSSSSYHPPGHYSAYGGRGPQDYPVMRNYSHDSSHRTSPPLGPAMHGMRPVGPPPGFQPPSEFAAPHNPHLTRRPPPAVYIMPTSQGDGGAKRGGGAFSWSKDDDNRLAEIMKKHKNPRDWEPISKEHGRGKNAKECHERWIRYLKPGVRKGQWTDQEDAIVIEAVTSSAEQPFTRWSDLAQQLPGRVGKQIRDRWVNHLNPNINHLPFSREDDLNLWNGHKKLGKRWVEISTKYFDSNRSENHIKNRWYSASFKKFITNEFGPDAYSGTAKASAKKDKKKKNSRGGDLDDPTIAVV
jgi:Myb-like DNA-binding domain